MRTTDERSHIPPRQVGPLRLDTIDSCRGLDRLGIGLDERVAATLMQGLGLDGLTPGLNTPSIATPIQFLQEWLPGFVEVVTAARKIDELVGITTAGRWTDEEIVQGSLERTGAAVPYSDRGNSPLGSWVTNFERRTIVRFEGGISVGTLEEQRSALIRVNSAAEKREAEARQLEICRNRIGFFGYNDGDNRTYGFLNDPNLPAYVTVPPGASNSTLWSSKAYAEITADFRTAFETLRVQSGDLIDPETVETTVALGTASIRALSVENSLGKSVRQWLRETYPKARVISAPELTGANGGQNVLYVYAETLSDSGSDGGQVFVQIVPAKFQVLGVEKRVKEYLEGYSNATAGLLCKRPWAVVRFSGI